MNLKGTGKEDADTLTDVKLGPPMQAFLDDFKVEYPAAELSAYRRKWEDCVAATALASQPPEEDSLQVQASVQVSAPRAVYEISATGVIGGVFAKLRAAGFDHGHKVASKDGLGPIYVIEKEEQVLSARRWFCGNPKAYAPHRKR